MQAGFGIVAVGKLVFPLLVVLEGAFVAAGVGDGAAVVVVVEDSADAAVWTFVNVVDPNSLFG